MNWIYLLTSYFTLICIGMIDNGRGALYDEILKSLGITTAVGSQIFALAAISSLAVMLISRWWLGRFNLMRSQSVFLFIQAISCVGMGISELVEYRVYTLLGFSLLYGCSMGGTAISNNLLVAKAIPRGDPRRAYSGLHSMYGIASLLSPLLVTFLLSVGMSWGQCFLIYAILPFSVAILTLTGKPIHIKQVPSRDSQFPLKVKILLGLIFGCYVSAEIGVSSRLVYYLTAAKGMDGDTARNYLSLFFTLLLIGRLSFGAFRLPLTNRSWLSISLSLSLLFSGMGLYLHPVGFALCGLSMSFFFPCGMSWINDLSKKESDTLIRWAMTSVGVMLIAMHWLIGQIAAYFSVQIAFYIIPLFIGLSLLLLQTSKKVLK